MATKTSHHDYEASSSSSTQRTSGYDVFISFRGEDTRKNFTDHLYHALKDAGIDAFRDDEELKRGEDITTELLRAIEESRISIIVFSTKYADSKWCLDELVKIMECSEMHNQLVLPVFYNIDPSDVRNQKGSFGEAFAKFREVEMDRVARWKSALENAGSLAGWDLTSPNTDGHEAQLIKNIVKRSLKELNDTTLHVAMHPVGIDNRVQDMKRLLRVESNDVRVVGICGMGGMGKTTIAKAVYNDFFPTFQGKSFLANVSESSQTPDGIIRLQEQLLSDILHTENIKIPNVDRGINIIKERLSNRKVLIVLDNVDKFEILSALAINRRLFGLGSRIIITTRDEHVLNRIEADETYTANKFNDAESLRLFSWHAFGKEHPTEGYAQLSNDVNSYCDGLPLALVVLGGAFFGNSIPEWENRLDKLRRIPQGDIHEKLKISYDALDDNEQRAIFLDISCFFNGEDKDYVAKILDGCDLFATSGIGDLTRRSLIKIVYNKLMVHDLLRQMARKIVRDENKDLGKRSRLCRDEDVLHVLRNNTGTDVIEGINLNMPDEEHLRAESFARMHSLRLLQLNNVSITEGYEHFPKELRLLRWGRFPLHFIPKNFYQGKLVALEMQHSKLTRVWEEAKMLEKLKFLDLKHSRSLIETPDFSMLPNLERLMLEGCVNLTEVHQTIGNLDKLVSLDLKDCTGLKSLPRSICKLKSLLLLDISGCLKLEKLPDDIGEMESLAQLLADKTPIREIPSSIKQMKKLRHLSLRGCKGPPSNSWTLRPWSWVFRRTPHSVSLLPTAISGLNSLTRLYVNDCNLSDDAIPQDIGRLSSLIHWDLSDNSFRCLPPSISNLLQLETLVVDDCANLQSLVLPPNLKFLNARNCTSLEILPDVSNLSSAISFDLVNCYKLVEIPGLEKLGPNIFVNMEGCTSLDETFKLKILLVFAICGYGSILLPEENIPFWFEPQSMGSSLSCSVLPAMNYMMESLAIAIVYASESGKKICGQFGAVKVINVTKAVDWTFSTSTYNLDAPLEDHLWVTHLQFLRHDGMQLDKGDQVKVNVHLGDGLAVKKCGVCLQLNRAFKGINLLSGDVLEFSFEPLVDESFPSNP